VCVCVTVVVVMYMIQVCLRWAYIDPKAVAIKNSWVWTAEKVCACIQAYRTGEMNSMQADIVKWNNRLLYFNYNFNFFTGPQVGLGGGQDR
jgi:hypothetical protein